jgi:hypothetical protein
MAVARSRQAQLQQLVAERGTVLPFVTVADLRHRGVGWYFTSTSPSEGCECDVCQAAREGRAAFIASGSLLAGVLLSAYALEHPAPEQEATG